jgi:hypothetical protein
VNEYGIQEFIPLECAVFDFVKKTDVFSASKSYYDVEIIVAGKLVTSFKSEKIVDPYEPMYKLAGLVDGSIVKLDAYF